MMTDKKTEALKLAREALTIQSDRVTEIGKKREAITAIREALAEPEKEQEPVPWGWAIMHSNGTTAHIRPRVADFFGAIQERKSFSEEYVKQVDREWAGLAPHSIVTLHTSPPASKPLTLPQIAKALADAGLRPEDYREDGMIDPLVRAIEAAHGIKKAP